MTLTDSGSEGFLCLVDEKDCTLGFVTQRIVDMCDALFDLYAPKNVPQTLTPHPVTKGLLEVNEVVLQTLLVCHVGFDQNSAVADLFCVNSYGSESVLLFS